MKNILKVGNRSKTYGEGTKTPLKGRKPGLFVNFGQLPDPNPNPNPDQQHWPYKFLYLKRSNHCPGIRKITPHPYLMQKWDSSSHY
jgi:hypothetical protein